MKFLFKLDDLLVAESNSRSLQVGLRWIHEQIIDGSGLQVLVFNILRLSGTRVGWIVGASDAQRRRLDLSVDLHPGEHAVHVWHAGVGRSIISWPVFVTSGRVPSSGCRLIGNQVGLVCFRASLFLPARFRLRKVMASCCSCGHCGVWVVVLVRERGLKLWGKCPVVVVVVVGITVTVVAADVMIDVFRRCLAIHIVMFCAGDIRRVVVTVGWIIFHCHLVKLMCKIHCTDELMIFLFCYLLGKCLVNDWSGWSGDTPKYRNWNEDRKRKRERKKRNRKRERALKRVGWPIVHLKVDRHWLRLELQSSKETCITYRVNLTTFNFSQSFNLKSMQAKSYNVKKQLKTHISVFSPLKIF